MRLEATARLRYCRKAQAHVLLCKLLVFCTLRIDFTSEASAGEFGRILEAMPYLRCREVFQLKVARKL